MASLGIAVRRSSVHGVLVRRKRIAWHGSVDVVAGRSADALSQLLSQLPPRKGIAFLVQPRVVLAIGTAYAQMKRVDGLSSARNQRMLTDVVRQNSAAFFLRGAARLVISDVDQRADGSNWAAAYHAETVDELIAMLRRHGLPRALVVPSIAAVASVCDAGSRAHTEDGVHLEITTADRGTVTGIRRIASDAAIDSAVPAAVTDVGADYLEAYAAALANSTTKLSWRPPPDPRRARRADAIRLVAAGLLFAATSSAALIAPGVRAERDAASAAREVSRGQKLATEAAHVQGELSRVSTQLDRVNKFEEARGKMTMLVGAIAQAIPDSTALVTLRVDSVEGSFVALTPHAADVLPELAGIDGIVNPRIAGSVTRETQGAARLERATVRFRRPRADVRPVAQPVPNATRSK
jgi:hypothetical protein